MQEIVEVAPISPMRRGLKRNLPGLGIRHGAGCTDLPDEEGTETVLAEDGEIDLEKSVLFAFCGLFHRNR